MSPRTPRDADTLRLARDADSVRFTRDAEWARLLGEALPAPEPARGAEARVLARVRERVWAQGLGGATMGAARSRSWPLLLLAAWPRRLRAARPLWLLAASCVGVALLLSGWQLMRYTRGGSPDLTSLQPGRFEAGESDRLVVLGNRVRLLLRAGGSAYLTQAGGESECFLAAGSLLVHVPEGHGQRFRVLTASTAVEVTGTVFGVDERPGSSSVSVWDGSVNVMRGSQRATLAAGQHWPTSSASIAISRSDLERLGARERVEPLLDHTAEAAASSAPSGTRGAEPAFIKEPLTAPPSTAPASTAPPSTAEPSGASGIAPAVSSVAHGADPSARPAEAAHRASSIAARYREAQRLEAQGARAQAATTYSELAESESSFAEAAAFAAARLRFGLGQYVAAQSLLEAHRARYPKGSYARAVDVLRLRVAVARADHAAVELEAARFLERFPDDPRAAQFRWARAQSFAQAGRCSEALRERPWLSAVQAAELNAECAR